MSVINQMLNDLDARHAAERPVLPNDIRPLPRLASGNRLRYVATGAIGVALIGGASWWFVASQGPVSAPLPSIAAVALPAPGLPPAVPPMPDAAVHVDLPPPSATSSRPTDAPAVAAEPALRISAKLSAASAPAPARTVASAPPRPAEGAVPRESAATGEAPIAAVAIAKQSHDATPRDKAERLYRSAVGTLNQGRTAEVVEVLQAALREDPAHVAARQVLLKVLVDARAWDAARAALQDGLDSLPQQIAWALLLSRLQVDRGDAEGALKTLERSLGFGTASADFQGAMGAVLHRLGRYLEAEAHYAAASRIEPAGGRWWLGRGMALEGLGRGPEARDSYQRAKASGGLSGELAAFVEQKLK